MSSGAPTMEADDAIRVDEDLGRQAVRLVGVEDLARPVEADGVRQLVLVGVGCDVGRRRLLDADGDDLEPAVLVARRRSRRIGTSDWQGGHHVAQKLSQTALPFRSARRIGLPSRSASW